MLFRAQLKAPRSRVRVHCPALPILRVPMWHSARLLSQSSSFGDVLHSFFGYSDSPTLLQLLLYVGYLAVVVAAYLGLRPRGGAGRHGARGQGAAVH